MSLSTPDFAPAIDDLIAELPDWYAAVSDPSSQMYLLLAAVGSQVDWLSSILQAPALDQVITSASAAGIFHNFAFAWGVQNEQLPTVLGQLVAYIQARASENGSIGSLITVLTALLDTAQNTTGGTVAVFPSGGGGFTFPLDGAGIVLYEFAPGGGPSVQQGLVFPIDGSGLIFPINPQTLSSDNVIVQDGSTPLGSGSGLVFSQNQFVEIVPDFSTETMTVKVANWLAFDRGAFTRAVQRFQDPTWYPTAIIEVPIF